MVISEQFKYVFVASPRTASNAIAKELIENYHGRSVLTHHSLYKDFMALDLADKEKYRTIIGIRNPLDSAVSAYYKYLTDHHDYSRPRIIDVGRLRKYVRLVRDTTRYQYVTKNQASFDDFFLRFYRWPYTDWTIMEQPSYEIVIRYENIQKDFAAALRTLGIEQVRDLPMTNKTRARGRDFVASYQNPETIRRAVRVFGPYMRRWNYASPEGWAEHREPKWAEMAFNGLTSFYGVYWKHLR